jgi:hypothetical protein
VRVVAPVKLWWRHDLFDGGYQDVAGDRLFGDYDYHQQHHDRDQLLRSNSTNQPG